MNKKLLIVEDEESMLKALMDKLTEDGFEVITAVNGEDGLKIALSEKPDLILLDIKLPKMDGMTMMKQLRASGSYGKNIPIIILTNLNADDDIMKGVVTNEPAYYLIKADSTLEEISERIRERLGMVEL